MKYELNLDGARKILPVDGDLTTGFWQLAEALPIHSIVALGWPDELSYWVKGSNVSFHWMLAQSDNPDMLVGYVETADPDTLVAGGDIEVAYLVVPPNRIGGVSLTLEDVLGEDGLSHTDIAAILDRTEAL
jgi:hypothetical protein